MAGPFPTHALFPPARMAAAARPLPLTVYWTALAREGASRSLGGGAGLNGWADAWAADTLRSEGRSVRPQPSALARRHPTTPTVRRSAQQDDLDAPVGLGPDPVPGQHGQTQPPGQGQAAPVTQAQDAPAVELSQAGYVERVSV